MPNTPCHEYLGPIDTDGYGKHRKQVEGRRRSWQIHRVVYEMAHGPIPGGLVVRHRCDNPPCVRVDHLELGTKSDNSHDMYDRGRNRNAQPGSRNGMAVLNEADVVDIRARYGKRGSGAQLAREYGVSRKTISKIIHNQRWRHVA